MATVRSARPRNHLTKNQRLQIRFEQQLQDLKRELITELGVNDLMDQQKSNVQEIAMLRNEIKYLHQKVNDIGTDKPKDGKFFDQVAQDIELVGLREVVTTTDKMLKRLWGFFLLAGIGLTIYVVYQTGMEYFNDPVATRLELIPKENYEYPPIILCPDAWLDAEKVLSLGLSMDALTYSFGYYDDGINSTQFKNINASKEEFMQMYKKNNFSLLIEYYKNISIDIDFGKDVEKVTMLTPVAICPGCRQDIKKIFFDGGVCFLVQFEAGSIENTWHLIGKKNIGYRQYLVVSTTDCSRGLMETTPLWRMYVTRNSELGLQYSKSGVLFLSTGTANVVRLSVERVVKLDSSTSPCVNKGHDYSSKTCYQKCISGLLSETVDCLNFNDMVFDFSSNIYPDHPGEYCNCLDLPEYPNYWARNNFTRGYMVSHEKEILDCQRDCPQNCTRLSYELSLRSQIDVLNLLPYQKLLIQKAASANLSVLMVGIEYQAMFEGGVSTLTEVSTISFTSFVSNIGGALGLFVGGTIMTLVQVILFMVKYWKDRRAKKIHPIYDTQVRH